MFWEVVWRSCKVNNTSIQLLIIKDYRVKGKTDKRGTILDLSQSQVLSPMVSFTLQLRGCQMCQSIASAKNPDTICINTAFSYLSHAMISINATGQIES